MEKLLSIEELSQLLGITKSTLYSWTAKKIIPYRKLSSRLIRFEESEILDWLRRKSVHPDSPHSSSNNHCHNIHEKSASYKTLIPKNHIEKLIESAKKDALGDVI
jgi:excisionase family DNA binding protein